MMKRISLFAFLAVAGLILVIGLPHPVRALESVPPSAPKPAELPATPQSINDLIEGGAKYDGQVVTIQGEVIGDIMCRGAHTWINVHDGPFTTIGVWGPSNLFQGISVTGAYKTKGYVVRITGTFRRDDPAQGGEMDIQASAIEVVSQGAPISHPIARHRIVLGALGILSACMLGVLYLRSSRDNQAPVNR